MDEKITAIQDQYLTFRLDQEVYAFDISQVQSVLDFERVTRVPKTPPFMRGVINLRGSVVPIVDLKMKFGMGETQKTIDACVIIVEVEVDGERTILGTLADSVQEVIDLPETGIEPPPKIGTRLNTEFIRGMGKKGEEFIIILDLKKIFTAEDLELVQHAGGVQEEAASAEPEPSHKKSRKSKAAETMSA